MYAGWATVKHCQGTQGGPLPKYLCLQLFESTDEAFWLGCVAYLSWLDFARRCFLALGWKSATGGLGCHFPRRRGSDSSGTTASDPVFRSSGYVPKACQMGAVGLDFDGRSEDNPPDTFRSARAEAPLPLVPVASAAQSPA